MKRYFLVSAILIFLSMLEQALMLGSAALAFYGYGRRGPEDELPDAPVEVLKWLGHRWLPIVLHALIGGAQEAVSMTRSALPQPWVKV